MLMVVIFLVGIARGLSGFVSGMIIAPIAGAMIMPDPKPDRPRAMPARKMTASSSWNAVSNSGNDQTLISMMQRLWAAVPVTG